MIIVCTKKEKKKIVKALLKSKDCPFELEKMLLICRGDDYCEFCLENNIEWIIKGMDNTI